jgi:hypothetical protein
MKMLLDNSILKRPVASKQAGLAMLEYGLIGITVLTLCIAGFLSMGTTLKDIFGTLKEDSSKKVEATKIAVQKAKEAADTFKANLAKAALQSGPVTGSGDSLCSATWCVSAPGLTGTTVQTAGGNGSQVINLTNSAANIYSQMAAILQEQGADPSLIALLTQMANQGHSLANNQNGLFNGPGDYASMSANINGMRSGLDTFKSLSAQLNASMSLLPADARGILSDASSVIIAIGNSYSLSGTGNGDEVGWGWTSINVQLTHSNSNTICNTGGDTSQCLQ